MFSPQIHSEQSNLSTPQKSLSLNQMNKQQDQQTPMIMQNQMDCVIKQSDGLGGVYLGSVDAANNKTMLQQMGIRSVLTVCSETEIMFYHQERINHKVIPIIDNELQDLQSFFKECHHFIYQGRQQGNVLVHCIVGVSRSATVVLSYLMRIWNMILEEALLYIICVRPTINPNIGFITQLLEYERQLYGKIYSTLTPELTYHSVVQNNLNYAPQRHPSYQIFTTPEKSSQLSFNVNGSGVTNLTSTTEKTQNKESIYFSLRSTLNKTQTLNKILSTGWPMTTPFGLNQD